MVHLIKVNLFHGKIFTISKMSDVSSKNRIMEELHLKGAAQKCHVILWI